MVTENNLSVNYHTLTGCGLIKGIQASLVRRSISIDVNVKMCHNNLLSFKIPKGGNDEKINIHHDFSCFQPNYNDKRGRRTKRRTIHA